MQPLALVTGSSPCARLARRWRFVKHRIKAQGGNQAHLTLPAGMPELDDTAGLIPKHGDGDLRQPPQRTTRIIWRAHWATVLCLSPRRSLTCGVGAGTLKIGKAQQRLFQGGVTTRVSTIQRSPLVLTARLRLEASGSR